MTSYVMDNVPCNVSFFFLTKITNYDFKKSKFVAHFVDKMIIHTNYLSIFIKHMGLNLVGVTQPIYNI